MSPRNRRFERQITRMGARLPWLGNTLGALSVPGRTWLRLPVAAVLILCGLLGFLPIVGFWMLPLGLLVLALDVERLRPATGALIVRLRALLRRWNLRF